MNMYTACAEGVDVECSAEWRNRLLCEEVLDRIRKPVKGGIPVEARVNQYTYDMLAEHIPSIPTKKRVFHPGKDMFVHSIDSMRIFPDDFLLIEFAFVCYHNGYSRIVSLEDIIGWERKTNSLKD